MSYRKNIHHVTKKKTKSLKNKGKTVYTSIVEKKKEREKRVVQNENVTERTLSFGRVIFLLSPKWLLSLLCNRSLMSVSLFSPTLSMYTMCISMLCIWTLCRRL